MNIKQLRKKVLDLAIRGKLVPQDSNEKPIDILESSLPVGFEPPFAVPESWRCATLGDCLPYEQPGKYIVQSTKYSDEFTTPVLTAGKTFVLGKTNETDGIHVDLPCIIFDDFTTSSHYVNFPFKVKSSAMKILHPNVAIVDIHYAAYFMETVDFTPTTHKRQWIAAYSQRFIPLPPLAEQHRIVAKLDEIMQVLDTLSLSQDAARRKAKQLMKKLTASALTGELTHEDTTDWVETTLGEISNYGQVDSVQQSKISENAWILDLEDIEKDSGKILRYRKSSEVKSKSNKNKFHEGQLLYSKLRPYLNKVVIADNDGYCTSEILPLEFTEAEPRYMQYIMMSDKFVKHVNSSAYGVKMPRVKKDDAKSYPIFLPPLPTQTRIVNTLTTFQTQINNLLEACK